MVADPAPKQEAAPGKADIVDGLELVPVCGCDRFEEST
jgi:hypothetical protein